MPEASLASNRFKKELLNENKRRRSPLHEELESRKLLSTVNVGSFGARPNDGVDDTAAIQSAIESSEAGDTIQFAAGTYTIRNIVNYVGNRTYKGVAGTVLQRSDSWRQGQLDYDNGSNIVFDGLTFSGTGILLQGRGGASNVTVQNCTFSDMNLGGTDQANMIIINQLRNSKIINNTFRNIHGDNGILGYNLLGNVTISGNLFDQVHEGVHITNFNDYAQGIVVSYNELIGIQRMGVEIQENPDHAQGGFDGLLVQGNYLHDFANGGNETFALSIVADLGTNTVIKDNVINGNSPKSGNPYIWYGIEAAGIDTTVENNKICTSFVGISIETGSGGVVQSNELSGIVNSVYWIARHPGIRFIDNTVNTTGDCSAVGVPTKPGDLGGPTSMPTDPDPDPDPVGGGGGSIDGIAPIATASMIDSSHINLLWTDTSTTETSYRVERSFDGGSFIEIAKVGPNVKTYQDKSLPSGTLVYYRVRWESNGTFGPYSNIAAALTRGLRSGGGGGTVGGPGGGTVGGPGGGGIGGIGAATSSASSDLLSSRNGVFSDSLLV